jgi:MSHA biogenesis protein MshP
MFLKLILPKLKPKKQQGSAIVLALFIIVVMSLLGTAMVRMLSANAENIVYEVVGTRAYFAAQAGMQEGLHNIYPLQAPAEDCTALSPIPFTLPFTLVNRNYGNEGLLNCSATVIVTNCESIATAGGVFEYFYLIESTGQCTAGDITTTRIIEVQSRSLGL